MNASDVIECYVTEVAVQLPRKQRNDVAFELRALLNEELQGRAEDAGRPADAAMATALVQAFGQPEDVAARYRPTLTIIDPADGQAFLRATVIGLALIWVLGWLERLRQPMASGGDVLRELGQWWGGTVLPSLWWPGVLVVGFGLASWSRRRRPAAPWQPRSHDRIVGSRAALVLAVFGIAFGLFVLVDPTWVLDAVWGGRAAPAAYEALTYTETFRHGLAPWLFALLAVNIPMYLTVIVQGRWPTWLRRVEAGGSLVTCALILWTVVDGPIFLSASSDQTAKFCMVLIVALILLDGAIKLHRSVRPAPSHA